MCGPPITRFANPVWYALQTKHRQLALVAGHACRYPPDVAPFAGVASITAESLKQLRSLLAPGEYVWLFGTDFPQTMGLAFHETLECLQMVLPEEVAPLEPTTRIVPLSEEDAPEMVALTDLTFPGFFRSRTCRMGSYFGVRSSNGELIALGGERILLDGYPEISAICTIPEHRGKGLAASIIWELARKHRREGSMSWLHVSSANYRAITLYLRLGFKLIQSVTLTRISRTE